ncbi:hypothetical protein BDEG_28503 [Batrachochytrium dendrobatidis JEL423]|uniref:Uncharacterized protein n=1 Tax=Batrachochytrium dendrobatidis (strain JEL423) TaxID=403673 RepID=A0A177WZG8_BATDL|nr:hypothetical protein BDEG_28503 [Batrachochytrium dendrobatidis JEL423]
MLSPCSTRKRSRNFQGQQSLADSKLEHDPGPQLALKPRLQECTKNIARHDKIVDIYKHLSEIVHQDTSRLGGSRSLAMIRKNLPEIDVCFIQAIAEQIYGEHVRVNAKADEED